MSLSPEFRLGPYEILSLLGAGSMGEVYRARDTRLGRQVAVKVLTGRVATDSERLRRFQREAQAASALNHPNVVSIFDIGSHAGVHFVVSELIEGVTLRARLVPGALPVPLAVDFARQLARGLAAAHERGVVHRDLKPENVMITRDDRVKILDFGIAKMTPPLADVEGPTMPVEARPTLPGTLVGTVAYMSPEQLRGDPVDHRSDIFSLGTVTYEMLAGERPFAGRTSAELVAAILRDDPPPLARVAVDIDALVRRCLTKAREDRFPTADEFADALERSEAERPRSLAVGGQLPATAVLAPEVERTIAVLPFTSVGPETDHEYFSDGLTEELIHELTRVRGLRVVAWNSAAKLKGHVDDVRAIAKQLGVGSALVGSVRRADDRVRISARLIDTATGYFLWSEIYDRQIQDLLAVQEEIARAIVGTLSATLSLRKLKAASRRAGSAEAYNLFMKGRFYGNKRTREGLWRGVECFEEAIAADRTSALAHAGLADALCLLAEYGFVHPTEGMPRAKQAALTALELDSESAEAHASYGLIRSLFDWEWEEAEAFFRRALELNPGYAAAHHWFAIDFLASLGRFEEAFVEIRRSLELDPLSLIAREGEGYLMMLQGRHDEALKVYRSVLDLDATFYKAYSSMGRTLIQSGRSRDGIEMLQKARSLAGEVPSILAALGQAHALVGEFEAARSLLARLADIASNAYVPSNSYALIHIGLGEYDRAVGWLERGCDLHELPLTSIKVHPAYDRLRSHPRFPSLLHRLHLDR